MTIEQAIQITENVFAATQGNLKDHQVLQEALQVLKASALRPAEPTVAAEVE